MSTLPYLTLPYLTQEFAQAAKVTEIYLSVDGQELRYLKRVSTRVIPGI